jgi:cytochrome b subunit of formate dehydrogenase
VSAQPAAAGGRLRRHGFSTRFVHWAVVVSTVLLVFSGLGQLPLYKRYMLDQVPGLGWASDFEVTLLIHYGAAFLLTFAVAYHVAVHLARREFSILPRRGDLRESWQIIKAMFGRGEEPVSEKYLAEQRVAYAFIGGSFLVVLVTGYVKAFKNLPGLRLPFDVLWTMTALHNVAMVLIMFGVAGHLAAFAFRENRHLIPGMIRGHVDADYARRRHGRWCDDLGIDSEG